MRRPIQQPSNASCTGIAVMNPGKMVLGKLVPGKLVVRKVVPGKMIPGKLVRGKLVPGKLRNKKSWGERRESWCVCGIFGCDQSMQTQNAETKNRGVSVEHRGVCVECSDMKTQNLTTNLPGLL